MEEDYKGRKMRRNGGKLLWKCEVVEEKGKKTERKRIDNIEKEREKERKEERKKEGQRERERDRQTDRQAERDRDR